MKKNVLLLRVAFSVISVPTATVHVVWSKSELKFVDLGETYHYPTARISAAMITFGSTTGKQKIQTHYGNEHLLSSQHPSINITQKIQFPLPFTHIPLPHKWDHFWNKTLFRVLCIFNSDTANTCSYLTCCYPALLPRLCHGIDTSQVLITPYELINLKWVNLPSSHFSSCRIPSFNNKALAIFAALC